MLEKFLPSRSSRLTNKLTNEPDANVADASRSECNSNQAQAQKFDTGHAIAVNWDGESASEHEQLTRFIHDAARNGSESAVFFCTFEETTGIGCIRIDD